MQSDRELLEMAAKAAGYDVRWHENWQCFVHNGPHNITNPPTMAGQRMVWVPLDDDGDVARLASRLCMNVKHEDPNAVIAGWSEVQRVPFTTDRLGPWYWKEWLRDHGNDRNAATRRAITRAASEIATWRT